MVKRLVIFLVVYAIGVGISPLFAHVDGGLKAIVDCGMETGIDTDEQQPKWPGLDDSGPFHSALVTDQTKPSNQGRILHLKCPSVQRDRVLQRPLYLLFHSFVFYELT